jgi:hypothetical protein
VQLGGPLVVVWDNLNTHTSHAMAELIATRDWLRACQLTAVVKTGLKAHAIPARPPQAQGGQRGRFSGLR